MAVEIESYVKFNDNINVNLIKVSTIISQSFSEADNNKDQMPTTTTLYAIYGENDDNITDARYFSPEEAFLDKVHEIYRKAPLQNYYDYICTLDEGQQKFYDYNVQDNNFYHYLISAYNKDDIESSYETYQNTNPDGSLVYYPVKFDKWSICNIEETDDEGIYYKDGTTWVLGYNFESGAVTQNINIANFDNLGRYGATSFGVRNYDTSTFNGLLGMMKEYTNYRYSYDSCDGTADFSINSNTAYQYTEKNLTYNQNSRSFSVSNGKYAREVEKLNKWKEFCYDGELKLLKDPKGNSWIVQIIGQPTYEIGYGSNVMQTKISFQWQEVMDVSKVSIIKTN